MNDTGNNLNTLSETLNAVVDGGYSANFKMSGDTLRCIETGRDYTPKDLTLVNHYRFEGDSNPDDMSVLYVLEGTDGTKGTIVDAYGTYAAEGLDEFLKRVPVNESDPSR